MILKELFQWALAVRECGGMRSSWPERVSLETRRTETAALHASTRRASATEKYPPIRKALDVCITVEACDSTSYLAPLLLATGEESDALRKKIPQALICTGCRIRRYASQLRTKRCPRCRGTLLSYPEMIDADKRDAIKRLNKGGIKCE